MVGKSTNKVTRSQHEVHRASRVHHGTDLDTGASTKRFRKVPGHLFYTTLCESVLECKPMPFDRRFMFEGVRSLVEI